MPNRMRAPGISRPPAMCAACMIALMLSATSASATHKVRTPAGTFTTSAHVRPGTQGQFEVFSDPPGCIADVITVESQNPDIVKVYAVDDNGVKLPGDGTTATVTDVENQKFVYEPVEPIDGVQFGTILICWDESGTSPCDEVHCPGFGWIFSVQVVPDPATIGQYTYQGTGGDPIAGGTGEFFLYPEAFLSLGGPMDLSFSIYWAARIRSDNNIVSRLQLAWLHNYDWTLDLPTFGIDDLVEIVTPLGRVIRFDKSFLEAGWRLTPYADVPFQLDQQGDVFTLMDPRDGRRYTFEMLAGNGVLTRVEDRNGNALDLTYDGSNRLDQVTDNLGRTLTYTYVSNRLASVSDGARTVNLTHTGSRLTSVTDAAGGVTSFTYDVTDPGRPQIASITRPEGNTTWSQTYDADLRVVTQTDANANTTTFAYDDTTDVTSITNPLAGTLAQTHVDERNLTTYEDETSQAMAFGYDAAGRRSSVTDRLAQTTSWTFHETTRRLETITDALGGQSTLSYTPSGAGAFTFHELTGASRPDGSSESYAYDANGNLVTRTDAEGFTTTFTYDGSGRMLTSTNPAGGVTSYAYNADHTVASVTDPDGNVTTYLYDALKRPVQVTRPDASTVTLSWDVLDRVTSVTDELGGVTTYTYDTNGNLTSLTTPLGGVSTFVYDAMDRLVSATDPNGSVRAYAYDALGRLVSSTDPEGNTVAVTYDALGRPTVINDKEGEAWTRTFNAERLLTQTSDPLGTTLHLTRNALSDITAVSGPGGATISATHDANGRVTSITDANGHTTDFDRDLRGLIQGITLSGGSGAAYVLDGFGNTTSVTDPRGNVWTYGFDTAARRTSQSDPLGNTTAYAYDSRSRVSLVTHPGGLGATTLSYDAAGRLLTESASDGAIRSYAYDADGRLTSADGGAGAIALSHDAVGRVTGWEALTGTRDGNGRLETVTYGAGKTVTYTYDGRGDVTSVTDWVGGTTTLSYDAAGRLTSIVRPNGVTTSYTYDTSHRVATITETGVAELSSISLTRTPAGEIATAVRNVPLAGVPSGIDEAYTHDTANRVDAHAHDAMGRRLGDGTASYTWDLLSRVTTIETSSDTTTYEYDGLGLWRTRTRNGVEEGYVWNRMLPLASLAIVRDDVGQDLRYFIHTPAGELLHAIEASDDSRHYHHYDEMGNTVFRTDDAGAVTQTYVYSPFGRVLAEGGAGPPNPFVFHGRMGVIREGGLYAMRARLYDPASARFLSPDPVEAIDPRAGNPYQAFYGNPLLYVDPRGTSVPITVDVTDGYTFSGLGGGHSYDASTDPGPDGVPGTEDDLMNPFDILFSWGGSGALAMLGTASGYTGAFAAPAMGSPDYRSRHRALTNRNAGLRDDPVYGPGPDGVPGTADDLLDPEPPNTIGSRLLRGEAIARPGRDRRIGVFLNQPTPRDSRPVDGSAQAYTRPGNASAESPRTEALDLFGFQSFILGSGPAGLFRRSAGLEPTTAGQLNRENRRDGDVGLPFDVHSWMSGKPVSD